MTEDVIVLDPGDEKAQKIAKAIASPMAGDILHSLADGEKTSSQITDLLGIPMSTAKYHIENLLDAGLLEVASRKWSVKGREVKVYRLVDRLVIVAPQSHRVRDLLLKYASLFVMVFSGSFILAEVLPRFVALLPGQAGESGIGWSATRQVAEESAGGGAPAVPVATGLNTAGGAGSGGGTETVTNAVSSLSTVSPSGDLTMKSLAGTGPAGGGGGAAGAGTIPGTIAPPTTAADAQGTFIPPTVSADSFSTLTPAPGAHESVTVQAISPAPVHTSVHQTAVAGMLPIEPALLFLIGGCLVIAVLIAYDLYRARSSRRYGELPIRG